MAVKSSRFPECHHRAVSCCLGKLLRALGRSELRVPLQAVVLPLCVRHRGVTSSVSRGWRCDQGTRQAASTVLALPRVDPELVWSSWEAPGSVSSWVYPFYRFSQPACDFELTPGVLVSSWRWQEPFPLQQLSQTGAVGAFVPGACSGCVDTVPGDRVQGAVPRALAACLLGTCLCLGSFSFGLWVPSPLHPPPHMVRQSTGAWGRSWEPPGALGLRWDSEGGREHSTSQPVPAGASLPARASGRSSLVLVLPQRLSVPGLCCWWRVPS